MSRPALASALLALLALGAFWPVAGGGQVGATSAAEGMPAGADTPTPTPDGTPTVTTGVGVPINATTVLLYGSVENVNRPYDVYFQYRPRSSAGTEWRRTGPLSVGADGRFFRNVTGLEPSTTYEYRAVLVAGEDEVLDIDDEDTYVGTVRTVNTTDLATPTPTPTRTPDPCPSFSGAAALCTPTRPPTTAPPDGTTAPGGTTEPVDEVPTDAGEPTAGEGPDGWFAELLPVVAWVALVVVVAPLVLGGLVGLDALRGGR